MKTLFNLVFIVFSTLLLLALISNCAWPTFAGDASRHDSSATDGTSGQWSAPQLPHLETDFEQRTKLTAQLREARFSSFSPASLESLLSSCCSWGISVSSRGRSKNIRRTRPITERLFLAPPPPPRTPLAAAAASDTPSPRRMAMLLVADVVEPNDDPTSTSTKSSVTKTSTTGTTTTTTTKTRTTSTTTPTTTTTTATSTTTTTTINPKAGAGWSIAASEAVVVLVVVCLVWDRCSRTSRTSSSPSPSAAAQSSREEALLQSTA
mmetsp:Transcript_98213/g.204843  ORF Transcript_98213/g.204843 Transcript_98213/m.204843 type:complete len:265 (+) Transcript_98213:26-820(+)